MITLESLVGFRPGICGNREHGQGDTHTLECLAASPKQLLSDYPPNTRLDESAMAAIGLPFSHVGSHKDHGAQTHLYQACDPFLCAYCSGLDQPCHVPAFYHLKEGSLDTGRCARCGSRCACTTASKPKSYRVQVYDDGTWVFVQRNEAAFPFMRVWVNEDGSVTFNQLAPPPANFTNKWEKASHTTAKVREADIDKKRKRAAGTKGGNKKAKGTPPSSPSTVDMPEPLRDALECYSAELVEKDLDASVPPSPKSLRLVADIAPKKTKALPTSAPWRKRKIQSHPDSDRSLNELLAMGFKWMPHNQGGVTASGARRPPSGYRWVLPFTEDKQ